MTAPKWFSLALILFCAHLARCFSIATPIGFGRVARSPALPDLYEASVPELQAGLDAGHFTSVDLVKAYFARIEEVNIVGPGLRAVLELNPSALKQAVLLDDERRLTGKRSALHGIPVLLKDNIATTAAEGMNTTAGSFSLLGSIVPEDAGVVKRLRKAGAIILCTYHFYSPLLHTKTYHSSGKANLSEFAQFRGNTASGWSGRGGQASSAYFPHADPCGSSSGSGIAASIGLAAVTLGTETDGSITCPSSNNNAAGVKPTVGLTSRAGGCSGESSNAQIGPTRRSIKSLVKTGGLKTSQVLELKDPLNRGERFLQPFNLVTWGRVLNSVHY
ncbi:amidase signature domain-containing protein [Mycena capillaripes]|nr:amidase signature domain-containing protein [Mycena capillaripes]